MRVAILADIHYSSLFERTCFDKRETGLADTLLRRAVFRLNRLVKPDLTLILGDLINDGDKAEANAEFEVVAEQLKILASPTLIIPGNHDGEQETFYRYFQRPPEIATFGKVRFVSFIDDEERPGYNAWRNPVKLELLKKARGGFDGHIITLQHIPVLPQPVVGECPYNTLNAEEIAEAEHANGVILSLAGHYHSGANPITYRGITRYIAPALCEAPFAINYFDLNEETGDITWHRELLGNPPELELVDMHIHTKYAYCNENMDVNKVRYLARLFGLRDFRLSEHSGHLLHSYADYGLAQIQNMPELPENNRTNAYFTEMLANGVPSANIGLEADICSDGSFLVHPEDYQRAGFIIGAIHELACFANKQELPDDQLRDIFLKTCQNIIRNGCTTLAHPFRVFRRAHHHIPDGCFEPLVKMLKEGNVAAEINFHTNEPPEDFFRMAIEAGVKITFGSDSHNLYEVGDFALHLDFMRRIGIAPSDLKQVLLPL